MVGMALAVIGTIVACFFFNISYSDCLFYCYKYSLWWYGIWGGILLFIETMPLIRQHKFSFWRGVWKEKKYFLCIILGTISFVLGFFMFGSPCFIREVNIHNFEIEIARGFFEGATAGMFFAIGIFCECVLFNSA